MFFLKKVLLGIGALFLILMGGAGTQSQSTLLQGGGFLGLIIGLIVLYIFTKMAWRAMGCLPSLFALLAIVAFILYAIGAFNNGIGNVGTNLKNFIGQGEASGSQKQASASNRKVINLIDESELSSPIGESFSAPGEPNAQYAPQTSAQACPPECQAQMQQQARQQSGENDSFINKLLGSASSKKNSGAFNPQDYPAIYTTARVISGDTLNVGGRYLRLFGVDAPEMNQSCADGHGRSYACGQQAAAWLSSWLQDNELECRIMEKDAKGNMVGVCSLGDYDIGAALVNAGWAVAYEQYTDIYVPYQIQAQNNTRGLWQGEFYMPWDWRKLQARKPNIKIIKTKPKRKRTFLNPMG